jgi:hypothetical protein
MRHILHIVTKANDELADSVMKAEQTLANVEIKMVDLTISAPDYQTLVKEIFAADSIQVW